MTALNIKAFRGKTPYKSARLLDGNVATEALNCRVHSGALQPIKGSALVTVLSQAARTIWRYRHAGSDYWLQWPVVVDVVRSPTAQDPYERIYFTGDGEPRMSTFDSVIGTGFAALPQAWFVLGVYFSPKAYTGFSVASVTGGAVPVVSRAYVYTFVTQLGEESAPCESPALFSGNQSGTWNLAGMELPPANTGTVTGIANLGGGLCRVTTSDTKGLQRYEQLVFNSVAGMTDINGIIVVVNQVIDATHFDVVFTTALVYTAGGAWGRRAPHNLTGMRRRIYRSEGTNTDYKFVAEQDATITTFADTVLPTLLGAACPTLLSSPPPKNLHSTRVLANGALAGIAGNQLCFSEPYKPYSWPQANRWAFAGTGVALVSVGNSCVVLTDSYPILAVATDPSQVSMSKMTTKAPCLAKTSVVDAGDGAIFAGPDGLYFASPSGVVLLTKDIYRQEEWLKINPSTFVAAYYGNRYYATHTAEDGAGRVWIFDRLDGDGITEINDAFDTLLANDYDGRFYGAKGTQLYLLDEDDSNRYVMFWQSAEFQMGQPMRFLAGQVHADYAQIVPVDTSLSAANVSLALNADNVLGTWGTTESGIEPFGSTNLFTPTAQTANRVQLNLLKDRVVVYARDLSSSAPFRLPSIARGEVFQIQIVASIPVYSATVAESMRELGATSQ